MAGERDLAAIQPANDIGLGAVGLYEQRDGDAGVQPQRGQRRAVSMSPKTLASSISVSPVATSIPESSTSRAVRPVGMSGSPAPLREMSTVVPG